MIRTQSSGFARGFLVGSQCLLHVFSLEHANIARVCSDNGFLPLSPAAIQGQAKQKKPGEPGFLHHAASDYMLKARSHRHRSS
jgi:hypothetical protein